MITAKFRVYCDRCQNMADTYCIVQVKDGNRLRLMYPGELGTRGMVYDEDLRDVRCTDKAACDLRKKHWIETSRLENKKWQDK